MRLPVQVPGLDRLELPDRPVHLAIGMFDGVHLGHRAVIETAVQSARAQGGLSLVLTFSPHPSVLFRPEQATRLIQDSDTRARRLMALGIDVVVVEPFTREFAALAAEEFLPRLRRAIPRLAAVYVGENFRFGQGRRGDVALLLESGRSAGVRVFSAPRVKLNGEAISSTRVRNLLAEGRIETVNTLLGYPYEAEGQVMPGKQLGRTLGFPTLNIPWEPQTQPRFGVYAVRIFGGNGGEGLPAVANYGLRPTVEQATLPRLEVHVLGGCPFTSGDRVRVEWLGFLRPERTFSSIEALRGQIAEDREAARKFFGA